MNNSNFYKRNPDSVLFKKISLSIIYVVVFSFLVFRALNTGNFLILGAVLLLPVFLSLMTRLDIAYVFMSILAATFLNLDRGGHIPISAILMVYMIVFFILSLCVNSDIKKLYKKNYGSTYLIIFLFITLIIMIVRGAGIRLLGSSMWGGSAYIMLILSILFYVLVIPRIVLTRKQIKMIVILSFISSIVGAILKFSSTASAETSLIRAGWLVPIIYAMLPIIFASFNDRNRAIPIILFLLSLVLVMLTGYRSRLVMLIIIAFGFGYFKAVYKKSYLLKTFFIVIIGWIFAIIIAPFTSDAMQRSLSFIPGISINYDVVLNAQDSNLWRIKIWSYAISELKDYWLVGRGVAFNVRDAISQLGVTVGQGSPLQAFHTHTYHSGPITLLVDFGIPGLIVGLLFMIFIVRKVSKIANVFAGSKFFEEQYFTYLCVSLLWTTFAFWFVFGDPRELSKLILLSSHVMIVFNSLKKINSEKV